MHHITYETAQAMAWDEAQRHATANGRAVWSHEDYRVACKIMNKLGPLVWPTHNRPSDRQGLQCNRGVYQGKVKGGQVKTG